MIERVPVDKATAARLAAWSALTGEGWSVTALLAPDGRTIVFLATLDVRL